MIVGVNEFVTDEPELTIPLLHDRRAGRPRAARAARDACAPSATRRSCDAAARRAARGGARDRERHPAHPRLRARVLHAVRDPPRAGGRVRRVPRAGVLLSPARLGTDEWWASYFDAHYLLEYEPIFDLARDRREVAPADRDPRASGRARACSTCPCGQGRHAHLLAEAGFDVRRAGLLARTCSRTRRSAAPARRCATRAATCAACRRAGPGASTRS